MTIWDVAREAGVSQMTVSRVFAGKGGASEATRQRIHETALRLGYRPNQVARSLAQARTQTVGLVMTRALYFPHVLPGAEDAAQELNYSFIYTTPHSEIAAERKRLEALLERRVDGLLIMTSSAVSEHEHLRELHASGIPIVTINRYCEALGFWRIFFDYRAAARGVVRRLLAVGHREVAFVGSDPASAQQTVRERIAGYREAMQEAGAWTPEAEAFGGGSPRDGETLTAALLRRRPTVTALLTVNDYVAGGALRALCRSQRRVPEDVAIVSFDDTDIARCTNPPLSSVRHATYEAGHTGCRLLIEQIEGRGEAPGTLWLPSRLVARESCGLRRGREEEEVLSLE